MCVRVCVAMRREFSADVCHVKLMGVYGRPDRLKNVAGQVVGGIEWSVIAYAYCCMHENDSSGKHNRLVSSALRSD